MESYIKNFVAEMPNLAKNFPLGNATIHSFLSAIFRAEIFNTTTAVTTTTTSIYFK
jgi:hypothetical protein